MCVSDILDEVDGLIDTIEYLADQLPRHKTEIHTFVINESIYSNKLINLSSEGSDEERIFPLMYLGSMVKVLEENLVD